MSWLSGSQVCRGRWTNGLSSNGNCPSRHPTMSESGWPTAGISGPAARCWSSCQRSTRVLMPRQPDVGRIARVLQDHGVDYVLVGGSSAVLRGATRVTEDFDTLVDTTGENLDRLAGALTELDAALRVQPEFPGESSVVVVRITADLLGVGQTQWRTSAGDVDVLPSLDTSVGPVDYRSAEVRADLVSVGRITLKVASLDDVIASKEHAARPKDLDALPELREIRARDERRGSVPPAADAD